MNKKFFYFMTVTMFFVACSKDDEKSIAAIGVSIEPEGWTESSKNFLKKSCDMKKSCIFAPAERVKTAYFYIFQAAFSHQG